MRVALRQARRVTVDQRLSYLTLGARSMTTLRSFYAELGWVERPGSNDEFTTYDLGSTLLALYPLELLTREAAPGQTPPSPSWNGVTLGINRLRLYMLRLALVMGAFSSISA